MSDATTSVPARKASQPTRPPAPPVDGSFASAADVPLIEFDSSAIDIITSRTSEIQALASCGMCLSAVEAANELHGGYMLTQDALPLLNDVIRRLADEVKTASDQLWEQYQQARAIANGQGCAA